MNILLVNDTSLYRAIFENSLAEISASLHVAPNGHEALQASVAHRFDMVAISMQLADMDGIALTRMLRQQPAFQYTPILILTGSVSQDLARKASEAGATEIFRKQDIGELMNFMQRFLARYRSLQGRVLYVEDNLSQQQAMNAQLMEQGLQVDCFSSADEAWQPFLENDYDLVITDIVLDGRMSGSRFVNRIRRQAGVPGDIPILAVTAFDTPARRIELFNLGVSDYVAKPVLPEELTTGYLELEGNQFPVIGPVGGSDGPGNSFVSIPQLRAVVTGDIVYDQVYFGVQKDKNREEWLKSIDQIVARFTA